MSLAIQHTSNPGCWMGDGWGSREEAKHYKSLNDLPQFICYDSRVYHLSVAERHSSSLTDGNLIRANYRRRYEGERPSSKSMIVAKVVAGEHLPDRVEDASGTITSASSSEGSALKGPSESRAVQIIDKQIFQLESTKETLRRDSYIMEGVELTTGKLNEEGAVEIRVRLRVVLAQLSILRAVRNQIQPECSECEDELEKNKSSQSSEEKFKEGPWPYCDKCQMIVDHVWTDAEKIRYCHKCRKAHIDALTAGGRPLPE